MTVIADVSIVSLGAGTSMSSHIARCHAEFRKLGLKTHLHALGTNLEGDWPQILEALKRCHEVLHETGVVRVMTTVKLTTRTDRSQDIEEKIASVARHLDLVGR